MQKQHENEVVRGTEIVMLLGNFFRKVMLTEIKNSIFEI